MGVALHKIPVYCSTEQIIQNCSTEQKTEIVNFHNIKQVRERHNLKLLMKSFLTEIYILLLKRYKLLNEIGSDTSPPPTDPLFRQRFY